MLNFEVASFSTFQDIPTKNHFVTAAEADIDDSMKRKRICFSLKNGSLFRKTLACFLEIGTVFNVQINQNVKNLYCVDNR